MACAGARRAARRPRRKTYYKIRASISLLPAFALVTPRLFALIPCAGTGSRSGSALPKQYRTLAGRALLHYTLAAFDALSELAQTLVVISPDDPHFDARRFSGLRFAVSRCGGASRQASVLNGLMQLVEFGATDADWVLVHDAARPGITPALIRTLISTLKDDPVGGIVALPVADTLKRVPAGGDEIARTEARDGLWQAQTPQMFRIGMLREAILAAQRDGHDLTDEASAIEWAGHAPRVVQGNLRNFKVTYPEDFDLAEAFLSRPANAS
ncbi:2-C-methyl-D-erythritol 4-phosphate cytidylyltransferase [Burkholderia sp. SJZ115]|jgi:2-C-methyl-D-erythritol 4-phosphate cytidylyltransferase|nr:2-C-methyl-D-erythritol 4-phosphate cytidylyltransferase [Burkholderia sp. SJZ089]TWC97944.1 2-C-methyl-D-erythritol 4-phosphate cytidylyltransferase [Burkholderia sp. SJZ115]TWD01276.1 2-C-methyl-D-erythritol 4-phosphate cytidylyltransferase [Burkholderia sp. SJZ091]